MNEQKQAGPGQRRLQKHAFGNAVFWGILSIFFAVSGICTFNAVKWVGKHFPGFLVNERMMVASVGFYNWPGSQAGLRYPDKILRANGQEVGTVQELEEIIERRLVGLPVLYEVERKGNALSFSVRSMRFGWLDFLMTYGVTLLSGIAFMLIGTVVFIMKPNRAVSWALIIACSLLSLWSVTIFDTASHFAFIRFYLAATALAPAAFVHFSLYFPEQKKIVSKHPWAQLLPYAVALLIVIPMVATYPRKIFLIFYFISQAYLILGALAVVLSVITTFFKAENVLAKQRAKVVLYGAALAFPIPAITYFSQLIFGSFFGVRVQTQLLTLPMIIFPVSIAYAIARHNLFDVDAYIKRAVGYVVMTAIIIGTYALISIPLNIALSEFDIGQSRVFPIVFTLSMILVFNPIYHRIQSVVDRLFFRKEYNYSEIVDKVGNAITSLLDLPQILKRLVTTFTQDMFIDTSSVMLLTPDGTHFKVFLADGEKAENVENFQIERKTALIEIIEQEKRELTKYDVLEDPKYQNVSAQCATDFEALNASLVVPLVYQDKVIGIIGLGEKKSGKFFRREDINLAKTISGQAAVAIENARMVGEVIEKERMEEELSIARDLQVSMLPAECPQVAGFEIAAYSMAAREVGGDFYDFIEMGGDRLGMVIGDVTGKSVSGALVMAASRSVFRMLSEEERSVAENMMRANQRLKKDVKSGMFVALLYAVLDGNGRTITLCSAGQTQPVFRKAATASAELIQTQGDTFPLGILDEAEYEETVLPLSLGDFIVLYTDGIVETMNPAGELFGFDRLLETVAACAGDSAAALLTETLARLSVFAAGAPQHDDLTLIVIRAE